MPQDMSYNKPSSADVPAVPPPAPRESQKLKLSAYAKEVATTIGIALSGGVAGYVIGKLTPRAILDRASEATHSVMKKLWANAPRKEWTPMELAARGAILTSIYSAFRAWRKTEGKQLRVKDIHSEVYAAMDAGELKGQVEQNERIQSGLKALTNTITPRGAYTEEAAKETAPAPLGR
jgi:hypothetical protein